MDCVSCAQNGLAPELPLRERLWSEGGWRVAHAWSALPGWLVVVAERHVESLADLTEPEAASLGRLLRRLSAALGAELGCERTYTMLFAELPGHRHVHLHLVPRMPWFGDAERGPPCSASSTSRRRSRSRRRSATGLRRRWRRVSAPSPEPRGILRREQKSGSGGPVGEGVAVRRRR